MTNVTQSFVPDNGNPSVPETGALPVAAKRVDFSYDTASQLNQITRYEDLAGTELVATSSFVFDLTGRLTDLTHQQDTTVFADYDWDYDAGRCTGSGRILQRDRCRFRIPPKRNISRQSLQRGIRLARRCLTFPSPSSSYNSTGAW
jgi:hypothetical protein